VDAAETAEALRWLGAGGPRMSRLRGARWGPRAPVVSPSRQHGRAAESRIQTAHRPAPCVPRGDVRAVPGGGAGGRPDRGRGGVPASRSPLGGPSDDGAARDPERVAPVLLRCSGCSSWRSSRRRQR